MTNRNSRSRLARNAIANWIAFLFAAVVGFFLSPFIVQHLGATGYGVWSLLAGLVGYLALLDFGIRQAVGRYVARHRVVDAHAESSSIVSAALWLIGLLGILALLISGVLAYVAPLLFNIPESLVHDTRTIVILGGVTVAINLIGGVFGGVLVGLERFDIQCGIESLVTAVRAAAIVLALREGYGLVSLTCIHLGAAVLNCILYWVSASNLYEELRLRLRGGLLLQMRTLLSFGASLSVIYVLGVIVVNSDAVVIAAYLPIESVTYFVIAGSLCLYGREMTRALAYVMTPRVSALTSAGSDRVGDEILLVSKLATLLAAPISATFLLRGESFITLWMGPAYGPQSGAVLRVLAVVLWLEASRSVVIHSLAGMARQRTLISGLAFEAVCKLVLSIWLVRPLGIVGVALGTLIPSVLVNLGYIPRRLRHTAGVPARAFYVDALLLPTLACVPFALASAAVERFLPAENLPVFFAQVAAILPLLPATAWFLCLTNAERAQIRSKLKNWVGR